MRQRARVFLDRNLWVVPMGCVVAAVVLAIITERIDRHYDYSLIPTSLTGTPAAAQALLTTIVSSLLTLMTLILTIMTLAVQLAMQQFSPRIVPTLLRDRGNKLSMGLFGGAAAYAFVAARGVDDEKGRVPGLTVLIGYLLMLLSLAVLVLYISRSGRALRASGLIELVGGNLRREVAKFPPLAGTDAPAADNVVRSEDPGVVVQVDEHRLVELAQQADVELELVPMMGDFVPLDGPLVRVRGTGAAVDHDRIRRSILLGSERTHHNDPAFALTKLVEIALRSMGSDPTTAIQAVDRIEDGLRQLARRELPDGRYRDATGKVRLIERTLDWDGYVRLGLEEIQRAGVETPKITRRVRSALQNLIAVAPEERRTALRRQLELLDRQLDRLDGAASDASAVADVQGFGSGPDLASDHR
ncbi:putative membrane protein [Kribbella voronezhensis]|uniref:Putative membrane protein n=1 Tax=Kribbella voronezhensis TaxID=2512212 RepID=A0A4R7SUP9_9ACTN|nr:DUF2254 family protein [Kribbella voronezhensis]TDU82276.1 putative membrane protein [Kribbella voronezhensis]